MNTKKNIDATKLVDGFSGQSLLDVNKTITNKLDKHELYIYSCAIEKVMEKVTLNRSDVKVLDKIDSITFEEHGICLKDAMVTKARIKACKKYGMKFIDRDFLAEHMKWVYGVKSNFDSASTNIFH